MEEQHNNAKDEENERALDKSAYLRNTKVLDFIDTKVDFKRKVPNKYEVRSSLLPGLMTPSWYLSCKSEYRTRVAWGEAYETRVDSTMRPHIHDFEEYDKSTDDWKPETPKDQRMIRFYRFVEWERKSIKNVNASF